MNESKKVSELERLITKVVKQEIEAQNKSILALPRLPLVILISTIMCLMIAVTTIGVKMATSEEHNHQVSMLEDDIFAVMVDNANASNKINELEIEIENLKALLELPLLVN